MGLTMNCRHCGEPLPDVLDAFCPHCRGDLANDDASETVATAAACRKNRRWVLVVVAAGLALWFLPLLIVGFAALALLGLACARSAIVNRQVGWGMGLLLGVILTAAGLAGIVAIAWAHVNWGGVG
jgi:hypothetical protein